MAMEIYAIKHKNEEIRSKSRSGGIFTALTDYILDDMGGVVCGCKMEGVRVAVHDCTNTKESRNLFRGSKYIESNLAWNDCFANIENYLKQGKKVLFSGTSCQVQGLLGVIPQNLKNNLYTVDILCHNIPSAKVWDDYLTWFEKKVNAKIIAVDFRNKEKFGWADHTESLWTTKKVYHNKYYRDLYALGYISRPCCSQCPYKTVTHQSDFTIGDFWGLDRVEKGKEFGDNKGISLVLVNTNKGVELFNLIKNEVEYIPANEADCLQGALVKPYSYDVENRTKFWSDYYSRDFSFVVRKYTTNEILARIKMLLPGDLKKRLRGK